MEDGLSMRLSRRHDIAAAAHSRTSHWRRLARLMNDAWITGSGEGTFDLDSAGGNFGELVGNSEGKLQFVMRNGNLAHVQIPGMDGPLSVHRFAGTLRAKKGIWELSESWLESRDGLYQVSGKADTENGLDFVLTRSDKQLWSVSGYAGQTACRSGRECLFPRSPWLPPGRYHGCVSLCRRAWAATGVVCRNSPRRRVDCFARARSRVPP